MRLYLQLGETLSRRVLANPPECFTPPEWVAYLGRIVRLPFRLHADQEGPSRRPRGMTHEGWQELRQIRASRAQACDDCTLWYQLEQRREGRCHPIAFEHTPLGRALGMDEPEEVPDGQMVAWKRLTPLRTA